ncbi:MAG: hypothetical protein U5K37_02715 [Natrialbaceae archaeon]|nr:hypothetical protein [Natrialbaceae archaeon]
MEADEIRYEALLEELEVNMETSELRVQLSHVHLPHLESAGLVEFDNRSETVRYHPRSLVRETVDMVEIVDS